MLHPVADKLCHVLMRFLLESRDQVIEREASATARVQHVAQSVVECLWSGEILQAVKEQQTFGAQDGGIFRLTRLAVKRNCAERANNRLRANLGTLHGLSSIGGGKGRQSGKRRGLLEEARVPAVAQPTRREGGRRARRNFRSTSAEIDHQAIRGSHLRGGLLILSGDELRVV